LQSEPQRAAQSEAQSAATPASPSVAQSEGNAPDFRDKVPAYPSAERKRLRERKAERLARVIARETIERAVERNLQRIPEPHPQADTIPLDNGRKVGAERRHDRAAVVTAVAAEMSSGRTLHEACTVLGLRPATVRRWAATDPEVDRALQSAKRLQADALADRAVRTADKALGFDAAGVAAQRLRVDTLKWYVGHLDPQRYGKPVAEGNNGPRVLRVVFEHAAPNQGSSPSIEGDLELPSMARVTPVAGHGGQFPSTTPAIAGQPEGL
jgi:hypothetical protein